MPRTRDTALLAAPEGALALIRRLFATYALPYRRRYALAFLLMALGAACTALSAYLIGEVINQAYVQRSLPAITLLSLLTVGLFAAKGFATYGHAVILARIGNAIVAENQRLMFGKLLQESIGFFSAHHSSEFTARLTAGTVAASQVINLIITAIGRDVLSLVGLVAVMVYQDPLMSIIGLFVLPPALVLLRKLVRRVRGVAHSQFVGGARVLETLQEMVQGIRIVKAFTLETEMRSRIAANIAEVEAAANRMARVSNRASPIMETLGGCAIALVILYGGYRVIAHNATPGEFFSFITAFILAYEPGKRLARLNLDLSSALVGVRILFDTIDSPLTEPDDTGLPPLVVTAARVQLQGVTFGYRADDQVLRDVSLVAEPGRVTALVGSSGGGKSTLLSLLLRFHDPDQGAILIDGQDIAGVSRRTLREQIALVGQENFLFRGTIRDNIAFGRVDATEAEIAAAAQAAFAHDFIRGFPDGYATLVGEHGLTLSGGQRQRIAIARALIKNAPIILLDEATAALDSESEREVQNAIAGLCAGRTTIVIAHHLQTVMHADRVHVLESGRVVESGRPDELLRKGGRFASFYRLQLQQQAAPAPLASTA